MNKPLAIIFFTLLIGLMYGCVPTTPTQTSSITDDRPVLMFNFEDQKPTGPVKVYIDGLYMGDALDFQQGELGLKIIAGTHIVKIEHQGNTLLEKKVYVGRGSTKTINLNIQ